MPAIKIGLSGYKELKKKLGPDAWRESFTALIENVANIGAAAMKRGAPQGPTGDAGNVAIRITSGKFPSARLVSTAKHRGYPYTTLLEFAAKYHHQGWALNSVEGAHEEIDGAFGDAARELEARWQH